MTQNFEAPRSFGGLSCHLGTLISLVQNWTFDIKQSRSKLCCNMHLNICLYLNELRNETRNLRPNPDPNRDWPTCGGPAHSVRTGKPGLIAAVGRGGPVRPSGRWALVEGPRERGVGRVIVAPQALDRARPAAHG